MNIADPTAVKQYLEVYKAEIKLPSFEPQTDIDAMLHILSSGDIGKLDSVTLAAYCVKLSCYAAYLTTELNRHETAIKWAESNIRILLGQHVRNLTDYTYQEKMTFFIANNEDAAKFERIRVLAESKLNTLRNVDQRIQFITQMVQNLAKERGWAKRNMNVSN
jgi:hypothetical protein